MAQILQNTLYLLTPKLAVRRDGLALRVEAEGKLLLSVPIHNVESLYAFGQDIYVSPAAMRLCWQSGKSICFFTDWGRLEARVEGVPQGSFPLRKAQILKSDNPEACIALARNIVAGKIQNTRWLIGRSAREAESATEKETLLNANQQLAYLLSELPSNESLDAVRGIEGRAAAIHFERFSLHLKPKLRDRFPFDGRNRRPPRDAINAMLSFFFALLRHDCVSALTATGLDPFCGYLHADRSGRESLALDLMEEFRPWVERIAITLLNRGEFKTNDCIEREGGAWELSDRGRKLLVSTYQERKRDEIKHPLFQSKVRLAQLPFIQSRLLARSIREDIPYSPHLFA